MLLLIITNVCIAICPPVIVLLTTLFVSDDNNHNRDTLMLYTTYAGTLTLRRYATLRMDNNDILIYSTTSLAHKSMPPMCRLYGDRG